MAGKPVAASFRWGCLLWCCCVAPRVFRAPEAPAAVCAGGRRPARETSALRASLGASPRSPARPRRRPSISHVIPLRLVQTLNLHRWNCNVFGVSQKMTTINYVRNLGGGSVVAARRHRSQAPPSPTGTAAGPSGALHTSGAWCADWWFGASSRSPARPRRRPPAPRQIPPAPSTPVVPGVLIGGSVGRLEARLGPAAAHRHRGRSLRRPSHRRCLGFLWLRVFLSTGDVCGAADSSLGYSSVVRCTRSVGIAPDP